MPANTSLDLVSIDFDTYKASLITFLQSQSQFSGYNFAGADLNVLLDLLSINTEKQAFFINMGLSEGFIDSAQVRTSILSHAKELNYCPRSARSSKANITVSFTATGANQPYILQKGQTFSAQVRSQNFVFSIPETITVASANTSFSFTTDIYEGFYAKDSYIMNTNALGPLTFPINNQKVDTTSLVVNVYEDGAVLADIYQFKTSLLGLNQNSKVYFLQTNAATGNYEILFGDGVVGYRPKNGSLIVLDYRIASGPSADGSAVFVINFDPTIPSSLHGELTSNVLVTTNQAGLGGGDVEDIETTRFYAPRWFQVQERAVIPSDYEVILQSQFPEISAVNAYGGETLTPPQFGKVVIALNISNVVGLPQSKIDQYTNFIRPRMTLPVFPIFTPAVFTYLAVTSLVRYNVTLTNETNNRINTLVQAAIADYNSTFLNDFNVTFRFSQFTTVIDNADPAIVSNITKVQLFKNFTPINNSSQNITLNFSVPLKNDLPPLSSTWATGLETTFISSPFTFNKQLSFLADDNNGNINIIQTFSNFNTVVTTVGTINYSTGIIQLNSFTPQAFDGDSMQFFVTPADHDVSSSQNTILTIDPAHVNLTIQQLLQQ